MIYLLDKINSNNLDIGRIYICFTPHNMSSGVLDLLFGQSLNLTPVVDFIDCFAGLFSLTYTLRFSPGLRKNAVVNRIIHLSTLFPTICIG